MNKNYNLPNVIEMEKAVLAAMLLRNGEIVPTVAAAVKEEDFYREEHKLIFRAIMKMTARQIPPNMLSLVQILKENGELEKITINYVMSLADSGYTTAYAETYSKKIKEKSILRRLIQAGEEISHEAFTDQKPVEEILDGAEQKILAITNDREASVFEMIQPILMRSFEQINAAMNKQDEVGGIASGFTDLDAVTNGFQKSDLILIAARPSMGKTAFALNLALTAALKQHSVAIFSLEMSKEQLGHRLLSTYSNVDSQRMRRGEISDSELSDLTQALETISSTKLFIDDTPGISIMELRSKARRLQSDKGLDLVLIDYLQLMQGSASRSAESRQQEISEISRSLKALARELNIPVIALSQLSRGVELRAEKRPQLSDLRESGSLEQDADIVTFLYREEYYNQETDRNNLAEIIIAKNRNGPTTSVTLQFNKECMRFTNLERYEE